MPNSTKTNSRSLVPDITTVLKSARDASNRGIRFSNKSSPDDSGIVLKIPNGRGRPPVNIFDAYANSKGSSASNSTDLEMRRQTLLAQHSTWKDTYGRSDKFAHCAVDQQLMPSVASKRNGKKIWTVYCAAEMAWILMGNRHPENPVQRPKGLWGQDTFVMETVQFWRSLNEAVESGSFTRKGPKPSPEALFKTALSTFVAKKIKWPKGGNPNALPSAREVSQIWYVLFGEIELHDSIKKRFGPLAAYCRYFRMTWTRYTHGEPQRYPSLGRALKNKYGKDT